MTYILHCYYFKSLNNFFLNHLAGDKDTQPEILKLKTFEPKYKSFEQELSEEYGLPELPKRATTYFY